MLTLKEEKRKMPKDRGQGVTPPILGKFTGRLRTPVSILAGFFVLGVIADIIMEMITRYAEGLAGRHNVGFDFWVLLKDSPEEYRQSIAYDDLILLIISFAILFIYKIKLKLRIMASIGFFFGWYSSSMWISPHLPQGKLEDIIDTESSEGF